MCAYRCVHNTIFTCVRITIPMISLRAFRVMFGLYWAEIIKENRDFNFNVSLTPTSLIHGYVYFFAPLLAALACWGLDQTFQMIFWSWTRRAWEHSNDMHDMRSP